MRHDVAHQPCLRDTEGEAFDYLETTTPSHLTSPPCTRHVLCWHGTVPSNSCCIDLVQAKKKGDWVSIKSLRDWFIKILRATTSPDPQLINHSEDCVFLKYNTESDVYVHSRVLTTMLTIELSNPHKQVLGLENQFIFMCGF